MATCLPRSGGLVRNELCARTACKLGRPCPRFFELSCTRKRELRCMAMAAQDHSIEGPIQANLADVVDGPNLFITWSPNNLGVMSSSLDRDFTSAADAKAMQEGPSLAHHFDGSMYFDGGAITGSIILLAILLALTFERILGLDRVIAQYLQKRKESLADKERWEIIAARQKLDEQFGRSDD
ncbi:hypothetical protein WJX72_001187 [[Myrmecia] bisecta]|uniref:Uncharacterized protein n=1 Tax=[Myrmecia] bisecta TaxID=41462 RepID=A0AAW1QA54_9CHLO